MEVRVSKIAGGPTSLAFARRELGSSRLVASSGPQSSRGVALDHLRGFVADGMVAPARDHHVFVVCLADSPHLVQSRSGAVYEGPARAGEISVMPAGLESKWDGALPDHVRIAVTPGDLAELASEIGIRQRTHAVSNNFRLDDPFLFHAAKIWSAELALAPHPTRHLILESITGILTAHILRTYTDSIVTVSHRPVTPSSGAMNRALEFIHQHPGVTLRLSDLAAVSGLSRFYFSRTFTREVGMSPTRYVERTRIDEAKRLLRRGRYLDR